MCVCEQLCLPPVQVTERLTWDTCSSLVPHDRVCVRVSACVAVGDRPQYLWDHLVKMALQYKSKNPADYMCVEFCSDSLNT